MRSYFPLTDYDFYAFVLVGLAALAVIDFAFLEGRYIAEHTNWSIAYAAAVVMASYFAGQVASIFASLGLEKLVACNWFGPPREYLLGVKPWSTMPAAARFLNWCSASHYSNALPTSVINRAIQNTAMALDEEVADFATKPTRSEEVFQYGYASARLNEDACRRLDRDRREYEFSRNLTLVAAMCALVLWLQAPGPSPKLLAVLAFLTSFVMLVRFMRYFVSYHASDIKGGGFCSPPT